MLVVSALEENGQISLQLLCALNAEQRKSHVGCQLARRRYERSCIILEEALAEERTLHPIDRGKLLSNQLYHYIGYLNFIPEAPSTKWLTKSLLCSSEQ
jgi:hypothetical protein